MLSYTYKQSLFSLAMEQEPTLAYLSSATAGVGLQALPLFIPAASMGLKSHLMNSR